MLKNSVITKKYGIPQRTLADWSKRGKGNWRHEIYNLLRKSDLVKLWELKYGEFEEEDDLKYKDLHISLNTELSFLEGIDLTQNIYGIKKDFEDRIGGGYSVEDVQFLVALKILGL